MLVGLFYIALTDSKEKRIPNVNLLMLLAIRGILLILECCVYRNDWKVVCIFVISGLLWGATLFLLCYFIVPNAIGAGDVKLFAILGCYLGGEKVLMTAFLSVLYAAFYGIWLLVVGGNLESEVAFSPFVFLGTVTAIIWKI